MYSKAQELCLMTAAVAEAKLSVPEDDRVHPFVGAIIADRRGEILCRSHRGESPGVHAESNVLRKAEKINIALENCVLFTSLEPCAVRGKNEIPCAEQIAQTSISTVYIGSLDPNPAITGRGEMFLTYAGKTVRRFEGAFQDELLALNKLFFEEHRHKYIEPWSMHAPSGESIWKPVELDRVIRQPELFDERNSLLLRTNDLVFSSSSGIWCSAGGLSWFRESFLSYLCARLTHL